MVRLILLLIVNSLLVFHVDAQTNGSINHDGLARTYVYYVPTSYSAGQSLPLVFVLHGSTQTGQRIMEVSAFNDVAESENFIVVYPDGINFLWNVGFSVPGASTADDVGFVAALVDEFENQYGIDRNRVYACGLSNGGYLSHRLACEAPVCFAAIASVAGSISDSTYDACIAPNSVGVMQIHGTADAVVSYFGGLAGKSVDDIINFWVGNNNCSGNPTVTNLPNTAPLDLSTVEKSVYDQCDDNVNVVLLKVNGGGHQWPGTSSLLGGVGTINQDINASQEIWNFFKNHTCSNAVGISQPAMSGFKVYPNPSFGQVIIDIPADFFSTEINVFNTAGAVIIHRKHEGQKLKLDLPKGVYFVRFDNESDSFTKKVVVL